MTNFISRPENIERIEKLITFLSARSDGDTVTWLEIEQGTGIPCRPRAVGGVDGRSLARRALKKLGREVAAIHGTGFTLSSPENVHEIMADRVHRTYGTIKRASRAAGNLLAAHGEQLTAGGRDKHTRQMALLATLTAQMKPNGRLLK